MYNHWRITVKKLAFILAVALTPLAHGAARAQQLFLADQNAQPGVVLSSGRNHQLSEVFRRGPRLAADNPGAVPKIQSVAAAKDGTIFFCSGLDGHIYQVRNRRESLVYSHRYRPGDADPALAEKAERLFSSVEYLE